MSACLVLGTAVFAQQPVDSKPAPPLDTRSAPATRVEDRALQADVTWVSAPRSSQPASATPASVSVITRAQLERTGERSLPRALAKAAGPSVWMQETNLGGGSPILRGLIGQQVLIVVDGVRVNDATTRLGPNQSLNTIDVSVVERVEVVRGPAAVLYGSDAVGGAILIWTRRQAPRAEGGVDGGLSAEYQSAVEGGRLSGWSSYASESMGLLAIGTAEDFNDLETADGEQDFTGYHANAFFGAYEQRLDGHRNLRLSARIHRDFDVPRTDRLITGFGQVQPSNSVFDFNLQDSQTYLAQWTDSEPRSFADEAELRLFARRYIEDRTLRATGSAVVRDERDEILGYGLGLDLVKQLGEDHRLTYGLDFERDDVTKSERFDTNTNTNVTTPGAPTFAPHSHYASAGLFARDEITSFAPFDLTVGVRYSYFDFSFDPFTSGLPDETGDFDALSASVQLARDLGPHWRATGTLAQGFRAPKLDDLAKNASIFGGNELANPDLEPETSLSSELALDYHDELWQGGAALHYQEISDFIGRVLIDAGDPLVTGDETYQRENTGEVALWGIEAYLKRQLEGAWSDYAAQLQLAFTRGRHYDYQLDPGSGSAVEDVDARRVPPLFGRLSWLYEPREPRAWLNWGELALVAASEQDELHPEDLLDPRIDPNGTDAWATLDLDFGGPLGAADASSHWKLGLHNLFDADYRVHGTGFDAPGASFVLGLSWSP